MTQCYLIGIGGSGAKSVEAFLHLAAAGLGPQRVTVGYIDPDASNGNLERCEDTRQKYAGVRGFLKTEGMASPEGAPGASPALFGTAVEAIAGGPVWSPGTAVSQKTLRELFAADLMAPEVKTLFDALFLGPNGAGNDPTAEQVMSFDEGFRGRPSVGAAVIHALARPSEPFWASLFQAVQAAGSDRVRLFLVGSAFGGTGAAGFPVVARLLRLEMARAGIRHEIEIAGALLLPYFSYPEPHGRPGGSSIAASANSFIEQSRSALNYYHRLLKTQAIFDSLYLVGWPHLVPIRLSVTGGRQQANPPMLPELYAALAAARFFRGGAVQGESFLYTSAGSGDAGAVGWDDLPEITDQAEFGLRQRLGQLLRFAVAYRQVYAPLLVPQRSRTVADHPWFRRLVGAGTDQIDSVSGQEAVGQVEAYCEAVMRWMAALHVVHAEERPSLRLFDYPLFALAPDGDAARVKLHQPASRRLRGGFQGLILGGRSPSLADLFDSLAYHPRPRVRGLNPLIQALIAGSAVEPLPAPELR